MKSLYVHIPFCGKKCRYCDFISYPGKEELIHDYLSALEKEVLSNFPAQGWYASGGKLPLSTIFIGGGTPSLLSSCQIEKLSSIIKKYFDCTNVKEITIEANPESLTKEKLTVLKEAFSNLRLSIGLQDSEDKNLKTLGRIHNVQDFIKKYEMARQAGINNINIDLIYGIPGQSVADFQNTLKKVIELNPRHISAYCLTIAQGTEFSKSGIEVDEGLTAEMYQKAREQLSAGGYGHYEISNFALPGYECEHNKTYWRNNEYYGIGCGAVSYIESVRRKNTTDLERYLQNSGKSSIQEEMETLDKESRLGETIMLGLRMREGLELTDEIDFKYRSVIDRFVDDGFMEVSNNKFFITQKGLFVSNRIMAEFI
ncbi:MAG: radical SAM family heme chaperone HemW [Elusimicrobiota bacterium]